MSYVLAVDQGTQSTRASILSEDGMLLAQASLPVKLTRSGIYQIEQDADLLAVSVESTIEQVLNKVPKQIQADVKCCGIATQRSTVVSWDDSGRTTSPALSWQDIRGQPQVQQLERYASQIRHYSGLPLSAHYGSSKLCWLMQHYISAQESRLGPISSYLLSRISDTETCLVDHANAQRMQLLDISTLEWSDSLARLFAVPKELLPVCCPIYHDFGELLGSGIPITAMNGDQNAAWFGSGQPMPETALVNLGSGAFILTAQGTGDELPQLLSTIAYSDKTTASYILEATVNGCGNGLRWLADHYSIDDYKNKLNPALQQTSEPALFLNTVGGLGSPWWRSGLPPRFVEQSKSLSQDRMLAGVCESILFLIYLNLLEIQKQKTITELHLSGGLSRVDQICQRLADLTGLQIKRLNQPESTTRGIAWIASGRPQSWIVSEYDRFLPRADSNLMSRFELFTDYLGRYIEGASHG